MSVDRRGRGKYLLVYVLLWTLGTLRPYRQPLDPWSLFLTARGGDIPYILPPEPFFFLARARTIHPPFPPPICAYQRSPGLMMIKQAEMFFFSHAC